MKIVVFGVIVHFRLHLLARSLLADQLIQINSSVFQVIFPEKRERSIGCFNYQPLLAPAAPCFWVMTGL